MKINNISIIISAVIALAAVFFYVEYPKQQTFTNGLMHIYYLDVGQGDSELIELPSKKIILIDGGPKNNIGELISKDIPFTATKIDLVVISHSHADHITGLLSVVENYQIGCIVYDEQDADVSGTETTLRKEITDKQIKVVSTVDVGADKTLPADCFSDPSVNIKVYSLRNINKLNEASIKSDQNLESNIVLLSYGDFDAVFTGDAEVPVQTAITPFLSGDIEVLKAAHHGSINGFYLPLIEKLRPNLSVISDGTGNTYGHPSPEVLKDYDDLDLKYARTDLNGTIQVDTDGHTWNVSLEKPSPTP